MLEEESKGPASVSNLVVDQRFHILYQGDDGSPLTYKSGNQHVLIGFVSQRNFDCGKEKFPGVYSRISFFRKWIEDNMKDPTYCFNGPNANADGDLRSFF